MRVYVHIPDTLLSTLQDQARLAHRSPREHLEWLLEQTLQGPQERCDDLRQRVERLEQQVGEIVRLNGEVAETGP